MVKGYHLEIHFLKERGSVQKFIKSGIDRLLFMDYGVSVDPDCLYKACEPFEKGYNVMVFPAVREGINWNRFKSRTLDGSEEPVGQRGLEFDTKLDKKLSESIYTVLTTDARAWAMDVKQTEKKAKNVIKMKFDSATDFFDKLKDSDIKICAFSGARCTVHFAHECFGNILETSGVNIENGAPPA
jgi:hypothetical protein